MSFHEPTKVASRGKWRGILMAIGIPDNLIPRNSKTHGPCPVCGGKDRFRFDDRDGDGTFICGQHGAGDGLKLVMDFLGCDFAAAAARVDEIVGNIKPDGPRQGERVVTDDERRAILRGMWIAAKPLEDGDLASRYLASRGLHVETAELRFAPSLRDGDGAYRPAMIARMLTPDGARVATLHRTFLRPDGLAKAEMASPRKLAVGTVPDGAAVRLGPVKEAIGIAEGIETALAAAELYEMPVWAACTSALLEKWVPPEGVSEVCIFGDNDPQFGGHAAAYALAHRLSVRNLDVSVKIPPLVGQDFNDVLLGRAAAA